MNAAIQFIDVTILFPSTRSGNQATIAQALRQLDEGRSRAEILASTGVVLGVARANLEVARGEISVLMGLSGSGKTTLLRAVNGLNKVTAGKILVRHKDGILDAAQQTVSTLHKLRTESVAMVFQQFGLLPWRTVRENVGLGLELRGMKAGEYKAVVDEKLELVGLTQWADRFASELSGGMQQRVGLARALATDADILLMDEPFSALDPLIRTKLQDELLSLQRQVRKTILFVSHDLDEALKIGNRISIMEGGRIVQTGPPEDIILRPADAYVAEFVQHMNPLNALRASSVMRPIMEFGSGGNVRFKCESDYELVLGADDRADALKCDGQKIRIAQFDGDAVSEHGDQYIAAVAPGTLLKTVLHHYQLSGHPVLICADGKMIGICRVKEILRGISGVNQRTRPAYSAAGA